jgi:ribosome-associated protein
MDIRKLQRVIVDGLEDVKAQNIVVFNTEHLSPLFERVIVASGTSNRQTRSLAASVRDAVKSAGAPSPRTEGEANGEWIVVDCGAAVVHVMQPAIREYYHLEELWGDKPVRVKLGAAAPRLVKAASPVAESHRAPMRRAKSAPVRRVVRTVGVKSAPKTTAKGAAAKSSVANQAGAKKTGAKKAAKAVRPAGRRPAGRTAGARR